jgi:hypothetical protein
MQISRGKLRLVETKRLNIMTNGKLVWLNFQNIDALTTLTKSFEVKSPNNVISILVDLARKTKDIQLKQMRFCPTCNEEYEIEQIASGAYKLKDHIRHCDLDNTNCKQMCKLERRVTLDNKDKVSGTNESNDNKSGQTDTKDEIQTWNIGRDIMTSVNGVEYKNGKKVVGYRGEDPVTQEELDAFAKDMKEGPKDY